MSKAVSTSSVLEIFTQYLEKNGQRKTPSTHKTKIPMMGSIGSLNVSVSAGVILYEAVRQRQL